MYISFDKEHLYRGAKELFEYISKLEVFHNSKISSHIRSDEVIVRLNINDYENAQKIINFINNNKYMKEGLNKINPFLPTIKGIGIMSEYGRSYNSDISYLLCEYLNGLARKNRYDGNVDEFFNFVKNNVNDFMANYSRKNGYGNISSNAKATLSTLKNSIKGESKVNTKPKINILVDALDVTYSKYGFSHTVESLKKCFDGDYSMITRWGGTTSNIDYENNYREELKDNLEPNEIKKIVTAVLELSGANSKILGEEKKAELFIQMIDAKAIKEKLDGVYSFDDICMATLEKYGESQLAGAIDGYIKDGNSRGFTRYRGNNESINYRDELEKINPKSIMDIITKSLMLRGVDTKEFDESVKLGCYISTLNSELNIKKVK